jgi:hypothetical protein
MLTFPNTPRDASRATTCPRAAPAERQGRRAATVATLTAAVNPDPTFEPAQGSGHEAQDRTEPFVEARVDTSLAVTRRNRASEARSAAFWP